MIGLTDWICNTSEVRSGGTADVYLSRVYDVLESTGRLDTRVTAEFSGDLPDDYTWGVYSGLEEVLGLLEGLKLDVWAMPEGEVFREKDSYGIEEPVMLIRGSYGEFMRLETALLGVMSYSSGVSTVAARVKLAAGGKPVYAFGIRRIHPAISAVSDRAAYVGGVDGVSGIAGAKRMGLTPTGTMPHSYILIEGSSQQAFLDFDRFASQEVPRIMLVDTYSDEKFESLTAAKLLGERLQGVRLDTPRSRRGDFEQLVREVRWELDVSGFTHVKIMVSGGLDEVSVAKLAGAGADLFGVGTSIAAARPVDFSMDLCEVDGKRVSKRGRFSGAKQVYRCDTCLVDRVVLWGSKEPNCDKCGEPMRALLIKVMEGGRVLYREHVDIARERSLRESAKFGSTTPS